VSLISAGSSTFASSLLGVSANGTDVYFFTHDSLAIQDHNGPVTKIYDARRDGGFFAVPSPPPCAASDECHGPGSQPPAPVEVRTVAGSPANFSGQVGCKSGFVRKHGHCVKKAHEKRHGKRIGEHGRGGKK